MGHRNPKILVLAATLWLFSGAAQAQVTTYCCDAAAEAQYIADLAAVAPGVSLVSESFEGTPWVDSRSFVQVSVTNQGLTWSRAGHGIRTSTGGGDVHDGSYLFYANQLAIPFHPIPDGFTITAEGQTLHGVGGWYRGNGTKIAFTVDGDPNRVDFTGAESTVTDWKFLGFIDTTAFTTMDVRGADEEGDETEWFWADDFHFVAGLAKTVHGDLDGDRSSDILWRNSVTGQNWLYLMDGALISTSTSINTVSDTNWQIVGNGDYDGDGSSDILWRNSVTGQNWLYLMDGALISTSTSINTVSSPDWTIIDRG